MKTLSTGRGRVGVSAFSPSDDYQRGREDLLTELIANATREQGLAARTSLGTAVKVMFWRDVCRWLQSKGSTP